MAKKNGLLTLVYLPAWFLFFCLTLSFASSLLFLHRLFHRMLKGLELKLRPWLGLVLN